MKIPKSELLEILWGGEGKIFRDTIVDTSRWSEHHRFVFQRESEPEKIYETSYSEGLTEYQDERPWQDEGELVDCIEVEEYQRTETDYRPIKKKGKK